MTACVRFIDGLQPYPCDAPCDGDRCVDFPMAGPSAETAAQARTVAALHATGLSPIEIAEVTGLTVEAVEGGQG